jgi:valyl-tRNA synthetase
VLYCLQASLAALEELDPEKAARKVAKMAEKAAKKAKAEAKEAAKAEAAKAAAAAGGDKGEGKRAGKKAEAEAKKVGTRSGGGLWIGVGGWVGLFVLVHWERWAWGCASQACQQPHSCRPMHSLTNPHLPRRPPAAQAAEAAEAQAWVDAARATPAGERKQLPAEMPKGYVPKAVEAAWYEWWQECGFFKADLNSGGCTCQPGTLCMLLMLLPAWGHVYVLA